MASRPDAEHSPTDGGRDEHSPTDGGRDEHSRAEGVLVLAYGTPTGPDDVEAYYTDIRRGRPPTAEQLADLVRRYDAIGGTSPLRARTEAQRVGLQTALDGRAAGTASAW